MGKARRAVASTLFAALFLVVVRGSSQTGESPQQTAPGAQTVGAPEPSAAEQTAMLDRMRDYASQYIGTLPDFLCRQTTAQYEAGKKAGARWHRGDVLTVRLVFREGKEQRQLQLVNNKPLDRTSRGWRTPLVSEGEFGSLVANVFDPVTDAQFTWRGWENIETKRVAVFNFAVDRDHSRLSLSLSDLAKAIVPYGGTVAADAESGAIWRIVSGTDQIPKAVRTRRIQTTISYAPVTIGAKSYLLPSQAEVYMLTDNDQVRNVLAFDDYRKFEAESTITFGSPDTPSPQP
jgi:hypothetical protein